MDTINTEITLKKNKTPDKILAAVARYQRENKDKVNLKTRNYYARVKEDPVRYNAMRERQRTNRLKRKLVKSSE